MAAVAFAQLGWSGDQQGVNLVGRGGVRLDRAAPGAQQRPQGGGVCVFGHRHAMAGQCGARSGVGVQWVRFALAATCGPIRTADLGHLDARGSADPGQAGTVAGGPFHPGDRDGAKALGPSERVVITGWARRELGVCQGFSGVGDEGQMVSIAMGVGADDDAP